MEGICILDWADFLSVVTSCEGRDFSLERVDCLDEESFEEVGDGRIDD